MNQNSANNIWLRRFAKLVTFATLFLIFVGGMVTSTGSGLSVPDWPLSYGSFFPPMVGGVFYEHGHRMVASLVGFLMLILAIWLGRCENREWIKRLGWWALAAVILQGLLGGLTVKLFLPPPVSICHGVIAQSFFILTILIAYSLSSERTKRSSSAVVPNIVLKTSLLLCILIYLQLILGATMRHTHSGLAIPDFPKMGGYWLPPFNQSMLNQINSWRFDHNLDPVTMSQVLIHFAHRILAGIILIVLFILNKLFVEFKMMKSGPKTIHFLGLLLLLQILLGITTILTEKQPLITSLHVVTGAAMLGTSILLFLQMAPTKWAQFRKQIRS